MLGRSSERLTPIGNLALAMLYVSLLSYTSLTYIGGRNWGVG